MYCRLSEILIAMLLVVGPRALILAVREVGQ